MNTVDLGGVVHEGVERDKVHVGVKPDVLLSELHDGNPELGMRTDRLHVDDLAQLRLQQRRKLARQRDPVRWHPNRRKFVIQKTVEGRRRVQACEIDEPCPAAECKPDWNRAIALSLQHARPMRRRDRCGAWLWRTEEYRD